MRSAALQVNDWTRWEFINQAIKQWRTSEGRFFPVSTIENVYLFDFIHSVALYKFLQLFATIALIVISAGFVAKLFGSWKIFPIAVFVVLSCLQTRNWYDPTLGFGLLLQSVQIKVLVCFFGVIKFLQVKGRKSYLYLFGSLFLWVAALLQYEVVVTLIPSLLIFIVFFTGSHLRKKIACSLFVITTSLYILSIVQLRAGVSASSAYTIDLDMGTVASTYLRQLSGGLPYSANIWSRGAESPIVALSGLPFSLLVLLVAIMFLSGIYRRNLLSISKKSVLLLFVVGLNFCCGPAITTALSVRWQSEVDWGLSYLSVSFFYTGIAFTFISVLIFLLNVLSEKPVKRAISFFLFVGFFAVSAVSNHALLIKNVDATKLGREHRQLYESAIRQGFLSSVPDNSVIVYPSYNENFWVNQYFTEWLGGPRSLTFVNSLEQAQMQCDFEGFPELCPRVFNLNYVVTNFSQHGLSLTELYTRSNNPKLSEQYFGKEIHLED